jgi:hypothetical protein
MHTNAGMHAKPASWPKTVVVAHDTITVRPHALLVQIYQLGDCVPEPGGYLLPSRHRHQGRRAMVGCPLVLDVPRSFCGAGLLWCRDLAMGTSVDSWVRGGSVGEMSAAAADMATAVASAMIMCFIQISL